MVFFATLVCGLSTYELNDLDREMRTLPMFQMGTACFTFLPQTDYHNLHSLYQAFIGLLTSAICPHCGSGEETAERLLLFCPKRAAKRERYFDDCLMCSRTVTIWWNSSSLRGTCPPHAGTGLRAHHDNSNNNNNNLIHRVEITKAATRPYVHYLLLF